MNREIPVTKLSYTIPEAVFAVGIGRSRLYEEISAGRLPTFKVGKRTLIASEDLRAWLDSFRSRSGQRA